MDNHNDMRAMIREMRFPEDKPSFYLLNVGETHYPYALPDEPPESWPRISGVHGVFKHLDDHVVGGKLRKSEEKFFNQKALDDLRARQVKAVKYLDRVVEELFDIVPKNTYITITADHGELFGEDGFFGHGPIQHDKVFEVPFVEGKLR
jgi:arylsulfatase A-like enzyme